jgi:tetratricopeptide (TPR) repeat protein
VRAAISLSRRQWRDAEQQLGKAIHLKPKVGGNYINRALARYNINNLRGAMQAYDKAIDLDPNNFIGHYNRAQLRVKVGDDNRAILDFA